jgi:hypothetical protein
MAIKNLASKVEKELARTTESYESLISTMREYIEANMKAIADKMAECGDILDAEISKKSKPKKAAKKISKPKTEKQSTPRKGGLLNHLLTILKDSEKPLTELDIAKILLENPEKYNWKNKSETTLYQTLRRGVKEKTISESGERSKETKTYQVA